MEEVVGVPSIEVVVVDGKRWNSCMLSKEPTICEAEKVEINQDGEFIEVRWPDEAAYGYGFEFITVPGHSLSIHSFGPITRVFISLGK